MRSELKDFSGGITDFIYNDDITTSQILDNLSITKDKGVEGRFGTRVILNYNLKPATAIALPQEIIEFHKQQFIIYGGEILRYNNGTWEKILGPNPTSKPLSQATINSAYSYYLFNKHLVLTDDSGSKSIKIFKNEFGNFNLLTCGLPKLATDPTITPLANNGKTYIYTFVYYNEYKVDQDLFVDVSATRLVQVLNASSFATVGNQITNIPVITNTTNTQYNTSTIKVKIYRTVDAGKTSYLVGTISNGVTTFTDTKKDVDLILGEVIYTDGGIADNDEPPVANHIETCNSCGYYANIPNYPYRLLQSQVGDFDSVPAVNYTDFDDEILALSSYQSNVVVFTENQLWRVEGVINVDGSGDIRKVSIDEKVTYVGGATKADGGIYFAGHDSFYFTDGYVCKKIPSQDKNIPERYKEFVAQEAAISVAFDKYKQRIYWAVKNAPTSYMIYVYDMSFNALTTWSGIDGSFSTISLLSTKSGEIFRGDISGHVFKFDERLYDDPIIDLTKPYAQWSNYPVIYRWKHIAFDFGASDINKWVNRVTLSGNGQTNLDLQINSYDDSSIKPKALAPISFKSGLIWGDEMWVWGDENDVWELEQRFSQTRHTRSGKIRCKRKQLEVTNAIVKISESFDTLPNSRVTVNAALKTATVIDPSLVYMPSDSIGDTIYINEIPFEISDSGTNFFKVKDPNSDLVDGVFSWRIEGISQKQRLHLSSVIFTYDLLDDRGGYLSTKGGENA